MYYADFLLAVWKRRQLCYLARQKMTAIPRVAIFKNILSCPGESIL